MCILSQIKARWQNGLCSGLQIRVCRFDSGPCLQVARIFNYRLTKKTTYGKKMNSLLYPFLFRRSAVGRAGDC